jgi:hypothetical protein
MKSRAALIAVLSVTGLMLLACGGDGQDWPGLAGGSSTTSTSTTSTWSSSTKSPSTTTTTRPSTTTEATVPPEAVDGTNLAACMDRTCDVWAQTGDVVRFDAPLVTNEFHVVSVSGDQMSFMVFNDGPSPFQGTMGGTGTIESGDVHVDVVGYEANRVQLSIRPR